MPIYEMNSLQYRLGISSEELSIRKRMIDRALERMYDVLIEESKNNVWLVHYSEYDSD